MAARQKTGDNKATDQNESQLILVTLLIRSDKTNADYLQVQQLLENVIRLTWCTQSLSKWSTHGSSLAAQLLRLNRLSVKRNMSALHSQCVCKQDERSIKQFTKPTKTRKRRSIQFRHFDVAMCISHVTIWANHRVTIRNPEKTRLAVASELVGFEWMVDGRVSLKLFLVLCPLYLN